jgi:hypothetical protein
MLYAGVGLRNDWTARQDQPGESRSHWWHHVGGLDFGSPSLDQADDLFGCLTIIAAIALLGLLILGVWILLEVVFPLIIPVGYALMLLLLTRVVHRYGNCRGNLLRAIALGSGWASLYTLPLALAIAFVRLIS